MKKSLYSLSKTLLNIFSGSGFTAPELIFFLVPDIKQPFVLQTHLAFYMKSLFSLSYMMGNWWKTCHSQAFERCRGRRRRHWFTSESRRWSCSFRVCLLSKQAQPESLGGWTQLSTSFSDSAFIPIKTIISTCSSDLSRKQNYLIFLLMCQRPFLLPSIVFGIILNLCDDIQAHVS